MRRILPVTLIAIIMFVPLPVISAEMGISGGYDLDRLLEESRNSFNFSENDAVFLLHRKDFRITSGGDLVTRVHTVIRISSRSSIRSYADLRIPYNSANSQFRTIKLRTWRDGEWHPDSEKISETAVVQTLPSAVARASDYSSMREVMLLHDGVELPCVIETEYQIVEKGAAEDLPGGFEIFPQRDPAMVVEYSVTVPTGTILRHKTGGGAGGPARDESDNGTRFAWRMERIDRLGSPEIGNKASFSPYLVWSTAKDWKTLGEWINSGFYSAAALNSALSDTVSGIVEYKPGTASKARAVLKFVNRNIRGINYNPGFWIHAPREAVRVWETGYGHSLDRAVIAAAMLREAGLGADLIFFSSNPDALDNRVPQLEVFDKAVLRVTDTGFAGFYDPDNGEFMEGINPLYGRGVWNPGSNNPPGLYPEPGSPASSGGYRLDLTITPSGDNGWEGTGFLDMNGVFCPYGSMVGGGGKAVSFIDGLVKSVLPAAEGFEFNPEEFSRNRVAASFRFRIDSDITDDMGRTAFVLDEKPAGGIMEKLPSGLRLCHSSRTSPVILPSRMKQIIRVRIKTGRLAGIHIPGNREITNSAGEFSLSVDEDKGWINVRRELRLDSTEVHPGDWPLLRALLLEETDRGGRTILLK